MEFLPRTFQLTRSIGPWREKDLWARGFAVWSDFERAAASEVVMSRHLDQALLRQIAHVSEALAKADLAALAQAVRPREHWRLYGHFSSETAFLDIEADGDHVPTVVGVMDAQGLASHRRGHNLHELPERLACSRMWVTFNGGAFDLPVLRRAFDGLADPLVHIDLQFLVRQAKLSGGLKSIEETLGLHRPEHLKDLRGFDAIRLWRDWNECGDRKALRLLTEYNLYDAVNLRSVLEWTAWKMAELNAWAVDRGRVFDRGEVLYDISQLVLALW